MSGPGEALTPETALNLIAAAEKEGNHCILSVVMFRQRGGSRYVYETEGAAWAYINAASEREEKAVPST